MNEELTQRLPNDDLKRILTGLNVISDRLATLEDKVDRRLQETRPIWEQVLVRLDSVDVRLGNVEMRLDNVETRLSNLETRLDRFEAETRSSFRKGERLSSVLHDALLDLRAGQQGPGRAYG